MKSLSPQVYFEETEIFSEDTVLFQRSFKHKISITSGYPKWISCCTLWSALVLFQDKGIQMPRSDR